MRERVFHSKATRKLFSFALAFVMIFSSAVQALAMQIFVEMPTGKTVTLEMEPSDTIGDAKAKIEDKEGVPASKQSMTFAHPEKGTLTLENDGTLADYENGKLVHTETPAAWSYQNGQVVAQ